MKGVMVADTSRSMLTTVDNPWNPHTQWDEWYAWDRAHGYHTPEYLARVAKVPMELSDADQDQAIDDAISEIVNDNVLGLYKIAPDPASIPE